MNNIEIIVKKVFKNEYAILEKSQQLIKSQSLTEEELHQEYSILLDAYEMLLRDAVKITRIGDINQKKLFESHEEIELQKKIMYQTSITDHLTGLHNRGFLMDTLAKEFSRSRRYNTTISCILFDIDDFKSVNDNYGHQAGDHVLKTASETVKDQVRKVDILGRYGGEEFLIILPNTNASEANQVAEKIRKEIAFTNFGYLDYEINITISLGVSDTIIGTPKTDDELIYKVDCALYKAKERGKNRSCIFKQDT